MMSKKRVASAFGFREEDLDANREGQLSDSQRKALQRRRNYALGTFILLASVMSAFALVETTSPFFIFLFLILALTQRIGKVMQLQRDLSASRITAYFGRIHLQVKNKKSGQMFIEDERGLHHFRITIEQLLSLRDSEYYRVYTARHSDTILAVEPVDINRVEDDSAGYEVDLDALAEDSAEVEKPKRAMFVLGDDGELQVKRKPQ